MAIQFARCEYVSRTTGGNACRKAAYNKRDSIKCQQNGNLYYFKQREGNCYHEVLLPDGADPKFKEASVLWNAVDLFEKRRNSQLCKEFVLALPDNPEITLEDRIELTRRFADKYFVSKGVAAQMDVHAPHDGDKNWHSHLLIATRRFSKDGQTFHTHKARDLDPEVVKGQVVEADVWGEYWRDLQNEYFIEKGLELRVDAIGIIPQEHLGPVRMRHHMNDALIRANLLKEANEKLAHNPHAILDEITRTRAVFNVGDIAHFCETHLPEEIQGAMVSRILNLNRIKPLYDKETGEQTAYFTTKEVRAEEHKLMRFTNSIQEKASFPIHDAIKEKICSERSLNPEQLEAFHYATTNDSNLKIIQGRAGVGKSYTLIPIKEAHEHMDYRVIGLAPTNKVARDLGDAGFKEAMTCHSLLFQVKNTRLELDDKTVLMVDEAAMMGTSLLVELTHVAKDAKLIFTGDERQLPSIDRGGMFEVMADTYESKVISTVIRQEIDWQRQVSEHLSHLQFQEAATLLNEHDRLIWFDTKEESLQGIVNDYARDSLAVPDEKRFVLAQRNVDVDALNTAIREIRKERGEIGEQEYEVETNRGKVCFSIGDRIQFTETDKTQELFNGNFGTLKMVGEIQWAVEMDNSQTILFDPQTYRGLRHGYAGTIYKGQGSNFLYTYSLHDRITNSQNSYVVHTRQIKDMKVYLARELTKDINAFVSQIGQDSRKMASLTFETRDDPSILSPHVQNLWTQIKDYFHNNEEFYKFAKEPDNAATAIQQKEDTFALAGRSIQDVATILERRLHIHFEKKYERLPEPDERLFHEKQATRTAEILLNKDQDPSYREVNIAIMRSRYELERTQDIKEDYLYQIDMKQDVVVEDHLRAQLYGERLAQIEGRLYEADLKNNVPTKESRIYHDIALKELANHKQSQQALTETLMNDFNLSKETAQRVAYESIRHFEKYGEMPPQNHIQRYIEIGTYAEQRTVELKEQFKELSPYQQERLIEFSRRREIEQLLNKNIASSDKSFQDNAMRNLNQELKLAQQQLDKGNELSR